MEKLQVNRKKYLKPAIYITFLGYIIILFKITIFRSGFSANNLFQNGEVNLTLFADYWEFIENDMFNQFIYLFVGNIIWFVPFGIMVPCLNRRFISLINMVLSGFLLSLSIEISQFIFGTGISEIDDLILNTSGVLISYLILKTIIKIRAKLSIEQDVETDI